MCYFMRPITMSALVSIAALHSPLAVAQSAVQNQLGGANSINQTAKDTVGLSEPTPTVDKSKLGPKPGFNFTFNVPITATNLHPDVAEVCATVSIFDETNNFSLLNLSENNIGCLPVTNGAVSGQVKKTISIGDPSSTAFSNIYSTVKDNKGVHIRTELKIYTKDGQMLSPSKNTHLAVRKYKSGRTGSQFAISAAELASKFKNGSLAN